MKTNRRQPSGPCHSDHVLQGERLLGLIRWTSSETFEAEDCDSPAGRAEAEDHETLRRAINDTLIEALRPVRP